MGDTIFTITDAGRTLIAKLLAGDTMHLTRIMFGSGSIPENADPRAAADLYEPVAQGTSDEPKADRGVYYITLEYNSSLNGGLGHGFWIREFGIFAMDPGAGEVMIAYGNLRDYPQFVSAYDSQKGVDVRRFPVAIAVGEDRGIVTEYNTGLWMTAEDVRTYWEIDLRPEVERMISDGIAAHNADPAAHGGFGRILNTNVMPRLALAELLEEISAENGDAHAGYENEFIVTFADLSAVDTSGNWNEAMARMEF